MVVASYQVSYTNRVPYLTAEEFNAVPLGLDLSDLLPGGSAGQQTIVLNELIARASARVDNHCMGPTGTLCATANTEAGEVHPSDDGAWVVDTAFWPILAVNSFEVGPLPGALVAIPLTELNTWIDVQSFKVFESGLSMMTTVGPLQLGGPLRGRKQFAQWTYVNGWVNTTLASSVTATATSIVPVSVVGIYPNSALTIWDPTGGGDESVLVASSYVPGAATVPLAFPLAFAHGAGVNVSALPATVKEATIHFIGALIGERGSGGFEMSSKGSVTQSGGAGAAAARDSHLADAMDLLDDFVRSV